MIGRHVSHFYVIRALGSGGMGVVYEAQDTRLPRSVAIKFLNPALARDLDAIRRFKREARLASSLNHPNICTILDVDEGEGQPFIAMELLHGRSLKSRLASGAALSLDEVLDIARQLADGLGAAHDQGIMHRDITPGNVFLTDSGVVKLLDFGLARQFQTTFADGSTDDLTSSNAIAGTIHYMAPELLDADAPVDNRCDLFSIGAVLYQMCTGARPFEAPSGHQVASLIREQRHVPMRHLAPDRPVQLERIIDKLLSKHAEDRYQTAWALGADLKSLPRQNVRASPSMAADLEAQGSIAVLPFEIVGATERRLEQFRAGLVEDISYQLNTIRGLRVAPRTSTRAAAGESVRAIGKRLAVDFVLEGSVQRAGHRVRVIASVVDAARERAVAQPIKFERRFDDLLAVQDNIAHEIAEIVGASILRAPAKRYTHDPEAYHAFKRGQHHWKSCFSGGWRLAIEQFHLATQRDPHFALAHAALANAYNFLGFYCLMQPRLAFGVAKQAAERALAIDEAMATAHVELALTKFGGDWDWEGSEQEYRRALTLDPGNALGHVYYSWLLTLLGRTEAAFSEAQTGHQLAPSSRLVSAARAQTLYVAQLYNEAIEACSECLRFDPGYVFAIQVRGLCYLSQSRHEQARRDLEQSALLTDRAPFYLGLLGLCYGAAGERQLALDLIDELNQRASRTYVPPQSYVFVYAGIGEREKALAFQVKAYEDGASPFNYLTSPVRELYALDPHHKTRLEQMRLTV
jgi:TolB-like protein/tRNA A-37 threonylcarbamoyl transferase component Bud32/Flp pilus assembly protein TadD